MKTILIFLSLIFSFSFAQKKMGIILKDSTVLNATRFLGVDAYNAVYYLNNNTLLKKTKEETYSYQNNNLGEFSTVDFLNPLEITLFYKDFNAVVQLDNRLSELKQLHFNDISIFATLNFASACSNHRLWTFNENTLQLEIFNTLSQKIVLQTQPITQRIIDVQSNYNYCWLLTNSKILKYNSYGSFINSYPMENFDQFWNLTNYFILRKKEQLFLYNKAEQTFLKLETLKIKIKDVFVKAETMYIYDGNKLYSFIIN